MLTNPLAIILSLSLACLSSVAGELFVSPSGDPIEGPSVTGVQFSISVNPPGVLLTPTGLSGQAPDSFRWFRNGKPLSDGGVVSGAETGALLLRRIEDPDALFHVVVSNAWGMATSGVARVAARFVDVANPNPAPPYTNWQTAATVIQDAIDTAAPGELILVANGRYDQGGRVPPLSITSNRVVILKPLFIQSVNGPAATVIQGMPDNIPHTLGNTAVSGVWLTNNSVLNGFTITRCATPSGSSGGGAYGSSSNSALVNCVVTNNLATRGGGVFNTRVYDSKLVANRAQVAGGGGVLGGGACRSFLSGCVIEYNEATGVGAAAAESHLRTCVVRHNLATSGTIIEGGALIQTTVANNVASSAAVANAFVTNSIIWGNRSQAGATNNYLATTFAYSCSFPLPPGPGNLATDPKLLSDYTHLASDSVCIAAGLGGLGDTLDLDRQPWSQPPSMGCDEWHPAPVIGTHPRARLGLKSPASLILQAGAFAGSDDIAFAWLKNGSAIVPDGRVQTASTANLQIGRFGPEDAGLYAIVASNVFGMVTSEWTQVTVHCVDAQSTLAQSPYSSWSSAAVSIQDAVDIAVPGAFVLVTNGTYELGGSVGYDGSFARVVVDKPMVVSSINGAMHTSIRGAWDPLTTNGPAAVRGVVLQNGALLSGFSVIDSATPSSGSVIRVEGAGLLADLKSGATRCIFSNNVAVYGGAISRGIVSNSIVWFNQAAYGGGVHNSEVYNSLVQSNKATVRAGGVYNPLKLWNCTISGNWSLGGSVEAQISQPQGPIVANSIIAHNFGPFGWATETMIIALGPRAVSNSCIAFYSFTLPPGNIVDDPQLIHGRYLAPSSPCIGAGNPKFAHGTDLEGEPWKDSPSMGCDELYEEAIHGPLSVSFSHGNGIEDFVAGFQAMFDLELQGRPGRIEWNLGDGRIIGTGSGPIISPVWMNAGIYQVTVTVFNATHPDGVSFTRAVNVVPFMPPSLSIHVEGSAVIVRGTGQAGLSYGLERSTTLNPPGWQLMDVNAPTNTPAFEFRPISAGPETILFRARALGPHF